MIRIAKNEHATAIFGYGSLILPPSVICRFDDELSQKLHNLIQECGYSEKFLDLYTSEKAIGKWKSSELNFVPAKLYGLKRSYSLESPGTGNKLAAEKSSDSDYINGVIVFPLSEKQAKMISETEESYDTVEKSRKDIECYLSDEKLREKGVKLPNSVKVYVATEEVEDVNKETDEKRNEIYHTYISEGAKLISEEWFKTKDKQVNFQKQFLDDFNNTTLEINEDGTWHKLSEK